MSWQKPEGMDEYLKATELCDCDNEEIRKKAKEIIKDTKTPKEAALRIFYFVRDEIPLMLDDLDVKASETLKKKRGVCAHNTNLQVALLRAVGIPARYHQRNVKKECVKGVVSSLVYNRLPGIVWFDNHCECYLSQRWVACESVYDKPLYEAMLKEGLVTKEQIPTIDWDGEKDLVVSAHWITEDVGTFPSLDDIFRKAQKEMYPNVVVKLFGRFLMSRSNRHTDRLRKGEIKTKQ